MYRSFVESTVLGLNISIRDKPEIKSLLTASVEKFPAMAASGLPEAARADAASGIPATDAGGASCAAALNMALDAARRVDARIARFSTGNWNVEVVFDAVSAAKVPQPAAPQGARRHTQHGRANFRRGDTPNTPRDVDHDWRAAMDKPDGRCTGMGDAQKFAQAQQQERRQHGAARTARKQRRGPSYRRRSAGRAAPAKPDSWPEASQNAISPSALLSLGNGG